MFFATCEFSTLSHWKKKVDLCICTVVHQNIWLRYRKWNQSPFPTRKWSTPAGFLLGPPKSGQKWEERAKTRSRPIPPCLHEEESRRDKVVWINCYHLSSGITDVTNWKHSENGLDPANNAAVLLLLRKNLRNGSISWNILLRALLEASAVGNALDLLWYQELCGFALACFVYPLMLFLVLVIMCPDITCTEKHFQTPFFQPAPKSFPCFLSQAQFPAGFGTNYLQTKGTEYSCYKETSKLRTWLSSLPFISPCLMCIKQVSLLALCDKD